MNCIFTLIVPKRVEGGVTRHRSSIFSEKINLKNIKILKYTATQRIDDLSLGLLYYIANIHVLLNHGAIIF